MAARPQGDKIKVLLVQDNPDEVQFATSLFKVVAASVSLRVVQGDGALLSVKSEVPDLVLIDYDLDGEHALDLLKKIKRDAAHKTLPVGVIGPPLSESIDASFGMLADLYIAKPLDSDRLVLTVNWLREQR